MADADGFSRRYHTAGKQALGDSPQMAVSFGSAHSERTNKCTRAKLLLLRERLGPWMGMTVQKNVSYRRFGSRG